MFDFCNMDVEVAISILLKVRSTAWFWTIFTVQFMMLNLSRKERVIYSIGHMTGPVIDGSISTLLGVIMLAWAEFDFIVT